MCRPEDATAYAHLWFAAHGDDAHAALTTLLDAGLILDVRCAPAGAVRITSPRRRHSIDEGLPADGDWYYWAQEILVVARLYGYR